jgi:hypothetical protein
VTPKPLPNLGKLSILPAALVLVEVACLCQFDPFANRLTTVKPNAADVIGAYVLTEQTLTSDGLDFLNGKLATIELLPNNTFEAHDFPVWQESVAGGYEFDQLISTNGNWVIQEVGGVSTGGDDIKPVWGLNFSGIIISASFTGNQSPYSLIFTFGDPDNGNVMIFEAVR